MVRKTTKESKNIKEKPSKDELEDYYTDKFLIKYLKKHSVTSVSTGTLFKSFYKNVMLQLDFLDDNIMKIYSEAFVFAYFNIKVAKKTTETNLKILKKAIEECVAFLKTQENTTVPEEQVEDEEVAVVNLFSFTYEITDEGEGKIVEKSHE